MSNLAALEWAEDPAEPAPPPRRARAAVREGELPKGVWKGSELGSQIGEAVPSGWEALDRELPGGGWPLRSITEILTPQPAVLEWRLLAGGLASAVAAGREVILVGPPKPPHLPGLLHAGLDERKLVWIQASTPAERLWVTEQLIKSNSVGAVLAWLPQARQEQIRRLQVCSQGCDATVFLCRPEAARHESSAAPLRVHATYGLDWELVVDVFKRRGPAHAAPLRLPSIPGGLEAVLTPRLLAPSRMFQVPEAVDAAVGSAAPSRRPAKQLALA
ncbi:translesion DNA synthesis-associated protein ImuA [Ramlibacter sp. AN1133]|uniref:translesion DNA synthesis-associated protein ImuA n=1 Tax=Ramlibacter sp. AN1133 TaxID=3133429 RepID=UPI0030BBF9DC